VATTPVPKRLKEARLSKGISQKTLGIQAGIDAFSASARINHYERGRHTLDYQTASRIARVFGMPTAYFYTEDDILSDLICLYGTLRKTDKKLLLKELGHFAIETCRECGGSVKVIACIEDPVVIKKILARLREKASPVSTNLLPENQAPPQAELFG